MFSIRRVRAPRKSTAEEAPRRARHAPHGTGFDVEGPGHEAARLAMDVEWAPLPREVADEDTVDWPAPPGLATRGM